ncbi:hypothetical protein [Streptomyces sp. NPDC094032]|uniref:hypothetical protein n=1 Tax=Streptomyces sp. NPDC094032 TaxID=3155308 RepID=UPI0033251279
MRPRAVGRAQTVARTPAMPRRRVTVLPPSVAPGGPSSDAPPDRTAPAVRREGRAPLGAPLAELPSTAQRLGGTPTAPDSASAPGMPVVQRQPDLSTGTAGNARTGAGPSRRKDGAPVSPSPHGPRPRSGLGAPLPALPPSAAHRGEGPAALQRAVGQPPAHTPLLGADGGHEHPTTGSSSTPTAPPLVRRSPAAGTTLPLVVPDPVTGPDGHPHGGTTHALQLLAARPLDLGLDAGDAGSSTTSGGPAPRPVVPARWPAPPATPQVQRTGTGTGTGAQAPTRSTSVRNAAPESGPYRTPLPVTGPWTPPPVVQPAPSGASPARTVPTVTPRAPAGGGGAARTAPVQRSATGPPGEAGPEPVSGGARPVQAAAAPGRARRPPDTPPQGAEPDLDELARRLLDPVSRLLRTDLRRGRERAGRPFDGRR